METIHRWLITYIPLIGYAAYNILMGFDNPLFIPLFVTCWIVLIVYQTIVTAVYTRPQNLLIAILSIVLTPVLLFINARATGGESSIVFIETTAIAMMSIIIALSLAFIAKGIKEGMPAEVKGPVFFTVGLLAIAAYFIGHLIWQFFEIRFDLLNMILVLFGIASTSWYLFRQLAIATDGFKGMIAAKKEFSAKAILITLGVWFLGIPLAMLLKMIMADQ